MPSTRKFFQSRSKPWRINQRQRAAITRCWPKSSPVLAARLVWQQIPQPHPMTNPSSGAGRKYYNVRGVPTFAIDGDSSMSGGGSRSMTKGVYDRLLPVIEGNLEKKAEPQSKLDAVMADSAIKVLANVTGTKPDAKLKLQIALVEEKLRFTGENGIRVHPMVVRSLAGENASGFALGEK